MHKFAMFFIVACAFIIRLFPLLQGYDQLIKAFDPYVQLRSTEYMAENGLVSFLKWHRTDEWFPWGIYQGYALYLGVPLSAVILYKFLTFVGFAVTVQQVAYFQPAIFGTVAVIYVYFLGKETINRRAGLLTALFLAVMPAFVSRTILGFFDNESIGVLLIIMTFYHFMRSLKRDSLPHAILAGISLGVLTGSWGAFRFTFDLLPLYAVLLVLTGNYSTRLLRTYTVTVFLGAIIGILVPRTGADTVLDIEVAVPLLTVAFLVLVGQTRVIAQALPDVDLRKLLVRFGFGTVVIGTVFVAVLSLLGVFDFLAPKFLSVILPTERKNLFIIASVSENIPLSWGSLFFNIHLLTFFIPVGIYFALNRPTEENLFIALYGVTTIYFTGSMVRLVLILAPAAALVAALAIDSILYAYALAWHDQLTISRRKQRLTSVIGREHAAVAYIVVLVLTGMMVAHGADMAKDLSAPEMTPQGVYHDWQETFVWLRDHNIDEATGKPNVVLSWWDYGYWITNYGNATTLVDNATSNSTQIGVVGAMLMMDAPTSLRIMHKYNIKYVLVHSAAGYSNLGSDLGKAIWMIRISSQATSQLGVEIDDYFSNTEYKYVDRFWDSVLYRLIAFDNGISQPAGIYADASAHPIDINGLKWSTDHIYFTEAFRSVGLGIDQPINYRRQPLIRIYEVNYPDNIEHLAAEYDLATGEIA